MKLLTRFLITMALLPAALRGQPPSASPTPAPGGNHDWEKVEALSEGDDITVTSARTGTLRCKFRSATDASLSCDTLGPFSFGRAGDRTHEFTRAETIRVRHRHFRRDRNITIAAFAVFGCVLGATGGGGPAGCLVGGALLGVVGGIEALIVFYWLPGKTIYEDGNLSRKPPPLQPQAMSPAFPTPAPSE